MTCGDSTLTFRDIWQRSKAISRRGRPVYFSILDERIRKLVEDMRKSFVMPLAILAVVVAVTSPIVVALYEARSLGMAAIEDRALSYAQDVIFRSEQTANQADDGIKQLVDAHSADPCSDSNIALMAKINLSSSLLHMIGYVSDNRLMCSSLGRPGAGWPLGPPDLVTPRGAKVRFHVEFPIAAGRRFMVLERDGYAAVVHLDLPLAVTTQEEGVFLAIFSLQNKVILDSKGQVETAWLNAVADAPGNKISYANYVIAVARSQTRDVGAVVGIPTAQLDAKAARLAVILLPIGVATGLLLSALIVYFARRQLAFPTAIRGALKRKEFFLTYQPVVDLQTRQWIGAEALLRWQRDTGEIVRPDLFIPVAEEARLIRDVTKLIFDMVAVDAPGIFRVAPHFHLAINVSAADLNSEETVDLLSELISRTGARPHQIIIEATERGFMKAEVARPVIGEIRGRGAAVAVDDFGTGYSSLSYLESFDLDYLKIDKSFIDSIGTDAATGHVIYHIIGMARSLKLRMIAEGIETEKQATALRELGVEFAQGWLFAKPMPLAQLLRELRDRGDHAGTGLEADAAAQT